MAYQVEKGTGDIVITGFDQGIGTSPYTGLTDLKGINISSVPGEAAVNFSTQSVTLAPSYSNLTVSAFGDGFALAVTGLAAGSFIEVGQTVTFSSSSITGISPSTLYYVVSASRVTGNSENIILGLNYNDLTQHAIGTTGTAVMSTVTPLRPKFFESMGGGFPGTNFMIDSAGRIWSDFATTSGGTSITATNSWVYTGNVPGADGNGNGLVYWRSAGVSAGDWDGWLFSFRDGFIDYSNVNGVSSGVAYNHVGTYVYGWNPITGTTGVTSYYLTGGLISACPHNAIVAPDGNIYFCDYFTAWKIQQFDIVTPVAFLPTNTASYIASHVHILPIEEISTCISPLGDSFIIGGRFNIAYLWNGVDQLNNSGTIQLAESYVYNIVTVNTNAYIFCGNRGNIYVTNGAQATPWVKVPDHISNTVEPYFNWGGATYQKDRLYFSVYVTDNAGNQLGGYGGIWMADIVTGALTLSNQLSYGSYTGYASAFYSLPPLPVFATGLPLEPSGVGLFIGWANGSSYGIDKTISAPYSGGLQAIIVSDMIPVGTLFKPATAHQVEFKLSKPLLSNESVELQMASYYGDTFVSAGITQGADTGTPIVSGNFPISKDQQQWCLVRAILISRSTNPSYCRITQLRIIEAVK